MIDELLLGAGSAATGGVIGALANFGMAWLGNKRTAAQNAHEATMSQERRRTVELAQTGEERMAVLDADAKAFAASQAAAAESSKILQGQQLGPVAQALLAFAEFFKQITRPGLTWYLVITTTLIAHGAINAGVADNPYMHGLLAMTGSAVGWWFSARPIAAAMRVRG